jgi:HEAT repeat protein
MRKTAFVLLALSLATSVRADLASRVQSVSGWVGYSVPIAAGGHLMCAWDSLTINWDERSSASALVVLYHVERGNVDKIRLSSPECPVKGPVTKIDDVDPAESIRYLSALIDRDSSIGKKALTAIALHEGAEDTLLSLARNHHVASIRGHALFWVSQRAGERAASTLRDAVDHDPEEDVRKKAVFAISQLPNDRSIPLLIELMRTHRSKAVRKKAAFWLGQKDDPRALAALEDVLGR